MNSQVNYIIHGILNLVVFTGFFYLVSKMPSDIFTKKENNFYCGTSEFSDLPVSPSAIKGKAFFNGKCASCHQLFKDATGPGLLGLEKRGTWSDRKNLYSWIRNPAAFMKNDKYTQELKASYGSMMQAFPDLSDMEIDAIVDYINYVGESKRF